jgi:hypothetical protein
MTMLLSLQELCSRKRQQQKQGHTTQPNKTSSTKEDIFCNVLKMLDCMS